MFYKENKNFYHNKKLFTEDYSLEFCLALIDKLQAKNAKIFHLSYLQNCSNKETNVVVFDKESNMPPLENSFYIQFFDHLSSDNKLDFKKLFYEADITNIRKINFEEIKQKQLFNTHYYQQAQSLLNDYHNIVKHGFIYDKYGEEYEYRIIENSDCTIGDILVIDEVELYRDGKQIGYLKAKYTTLDILEHIEEIPYSFLLKKKYSVKDKKEFLTQQNISYESDNYLSLFKEEIKRLQTKMSKFLDNYAMFNNIATTDYSYIDNHYRGLGLGKEMYLLIAEHLQSKHISFRSSSLQSSEAKSLWAKFKEYSPQALEAIKIKNIDYLLLKDFSQIPKNKPNKHLIKSSLK